MNSPCLECINRKIGCHNNCKEYIGFAQERYKINQLRHEEVETSIFTSGYLKKSRDKLNGR